MSNLRRLQQDFRAMLLSPAKGWSSQAMGIRDEPPVAFSDRIEIYHYAYLGRLEDCLIEDFPAVRRWLGKAGFKKRLRKFFNACPTPYSVIGEIGRDFPDFLGGNPEPGDPPFLAKLAALEWAELEARITAGNTEELVPLTQMADVDWERFEFAMSPGMSLLESSFPVDRLRTPRLLEPEKEEKTYRFYVYRTHAGGVRTDRARPVLWELLAYILAGRNIAEVLLWLETRKVSPTQVQKWFATLSARGTVQGLRRQMVSTDHRPAP